MDRKYTINAINDRVKYIAMQESGPVGSETSLDNVMWLLKQGKPYPAMSMPGYSIGVTVKGMEYCIAGEWSTEETEVKAEPVQPKPRRKKRLKDIVCE